MTERLTDEALRALVDDAHAGPWEWQGRHNSLKLSTTHSGRQYVMGFVRQGMGGAQPTFQPVQGRGMVKASDLLKFEVGDQDVIGIEAARNDGSVYRYDVRGIDCADAKLIALAPTLAAEVLELRARVAAANEMAAAIGDWSCPRPHNGMSSPRPDHPLLRAAAAFRATSTEASA